MHARAIAASVTVLLAAAAPVGAAEEVRVRLQNADGKSIGEATLREAPHGVLVDLALQGVPPGTHGFHFHEKGACVPPFESAGSHFNPTKAHHGFENAGGPHLGDLPNLVVDKNGAVRAELFVQGVTLEAGQPNSLVDGDGTALILHGKADDHRTDPAGNAGDRIACGIVGRSLAKKQDSPNLGRSGETSRPAPAGDAPAPLPSDPDPRSRAADRESGGRP